MTLCPHHLVASEKPSLLFLVQAMVTLTSHTGCLGGLFHPGCRRKLVVPQWMTGQTVRDNASFRIRLTWPQLSLLGPGWGKIR